FDEQARGVVALGRVRAGLLVVLRLVGLGERPQRAAVGRAGQLAGAGDLRALGAARTGGGDETLIERAVTAHEHALDAGVGELPGQPAGLGVAPAGVHDAGLQAGGPHLVERAPSALRL